jgi:hypothetical protein
LAHPFYGFKGEIMQEKLEKDMQPPVPVPREGLRLDQIEGNPQGWDLEDIAGEASDKTDDEIYREARREDKPEDESDVPGKANG